MKFLKNLFGRRKAQSSLPNPADDVTVGVGQCPHCSRSIEFEIPPAVVGTKNVIHTFECPECGETIYFMDNTMYK